jgi:hypothetical protein
LTNDKVAKKLLLNLNRKDIKISYEGEEYIFAEPSFEEVIILQQSESMSDAYKVTKARQLDGIDFDTLGASTQVYLMHKYIEWVAKMVNKVL